MPWKNHLSKEERKSLEEIRHSKQFASLVRKGLFIALLWHINEDRKKSSSSRYKGHRSFLASPNPHGRQLWTMQLNK